jgi:hypothetical protein
MSTITSWLAGSASSSVAFPYCGWVTSISVLGPTSATKCTLSNIDEALTMSPARFRAAITVAFRAVPLPSNAVM